MPHTPCSISRPSRWAWPGIAVPSASSIHVVAVIAEDQRAAKSAGSASSPVPWVAVPIIVPTAVMRASCRSVRSCAERSGSFSSRLS